METILGWLVTKNKKQIKFSSISYSFILFGMKFEFSVKKQKKEMPQRILLKVANVEGEACFEVP